VAAEPGEGSAHQTRALARFLASLTARPQPLLLDLGPVIGTNVTFFGEELGCKIIVENLFKDIDRHVTEAKLEDLAAFFEGRFSQEDGTVDGILCWDVLDYVERPAAHALASRLMRMLRPEGALLAHFNATERLGSADPTYTKYVVMDRHTMEYRPYAAARGKRQPLANRDIQRMFEPLRISEQFLLKNNLREVLFRKAAAAAPAPQP